MSSMKRVTVFFNGKVWYETDGIAEFKKYPVGAYVRRVKVHGSGELTKIFWDRVCAGEFERELVKESFDSLPDWVKTWLLVLQ
jgi:hypothetical protein